MAHTADEIIKLINRTKSTPVLIGDSDVSYDNDYTINLDAPGTAHETAGDVFIFQYTRDKGNGNDPVTVSVNGSTDRRIKIQNTAGALRDMSLQDIVRYNIYIIYRAGSFWHYIGGTRVDVPGAFALWTDVPTLITSLQDGDRFLVGDASAQGQNRVVAYQTLRDLIRIAVTEDGSTVVADPSFIDFRGGIDDVTVDGGGVRVAVTEFIKTRTSVPVAADMNLAELDIQRTSDNFAQKAYIRSNRKNPFFQITPADLGDGHIGYATGGLTGLSGGYAVNSGGSTTYNDIAAISEQFRSFADSTFTRIGSFTFTSGTRGMGSYNNNLYHAEVSSSNLRIRAFNPGNGSIISTSANALPSENNPQGFTVMNGIGYVYGNQRNRFYSYDIDNTTWAQFSEDVNVSEVVGLANNGTNVYIIYRNSSSQFFVAELDISDGSISGEQRLTGYESDDSEAQTEGFTAVGSTLFVSTQDAGTSNPHLYEVNPSNGNLTVVGDISPSNTDLNHLTFLNDYIYAFNAVNRGLYRTEAAMGNRWVAIFTNASQEIDDTDTKLRLFKQSGADEIELIRDNDITDAVVFVSGYDDQTAHTIAVGTNENPALYKADGTTLFEGGNEAILAELPIGTPKVKTRGQLIATTDELPTAMNSSYITAIEWTIDSDAPDGFEVDADGSRDHRLYIPNLPPSGVNGLEITVEVNNIERNMAFAPWGPGSLQADGPNDEYNIGSLEAGVESNRNSQKFDVLYFREDVYAAGEPQKAYILLHGDGNVLPSDTIVKVYLSGAFIDFETNLQIGV